MTHSILADTATDELRRIYIVSCKEAQTQPWYLERRSRVQQLFPNQRISQADTEFTSRGARRRQWQAVVRSIDRVVIVTDADGLLDSDSWSELMTLYGYGIPIHHLTDSGELVGFLDSGDVTAERMNTRRGRFVRIARTVSTDHLAGQPLDANTLKRFEADMRSFAAQKFSIFDLLIPGITRNAGGR